MKISCEIAADLMPLYQDDGCSEDSRAALEEHLRTCPSCRARLNRMRSDLAGGSSMEKPVPDLAAYAKKVRHHRLRMAILTFAAVLMLSALGALCWLTIRDMVQQASPPVFEIEPGTCNLTAGSLETSVEEIGQAVFYTNNAQIKVEEEKNGSFQGTVMLWDTKYESSFIQTGYVSEKTPECIFTNLSSACRYQISCEGLDGAKLTISEGRTVSFWQSLRTVLRQIT